MRLPASFKWIGLALIGLVIAAVVALAATGLISRQIGIDSESITAGDTLAPAFTKGHARDTGENGGTPAGEAPTTSATPSTEGNPSESPASTESPGPTESTETTEPVEAGEPSESGGDGGGEGPDD